MSMWKKKKTLKGKEVFKAAWEHQPETPLSTTVDFSPRSKSRAPEETRAKGNASLHSRSKEQYHQANGLDLLLSTAVLSKRWSRRSTEAVNLGRIWTLVRRSVRRISLKPWALEFFSLVLSPGFTTIHWVNRSKLCSLSNLGSCVSKVGIYIMNS